MFTDRSKLLLHNPAQMNYGIAVTDVDNDGAFELFVCGFGFRNLVLKWNGARFVDIADTQLADPTRQAIGVAAGDLDGDGLEEIYVLNTDTFGGRKQFGDRLFDCMDNRWSDLFALDMNKKVLNLTAGRSVACVDRNGTGQYGFFIANYGGPIRLYELDDDGRLWDAAPEAKLDLVTGGRSVVALPLLSSYMDIFTGNESGPNYLFRNRGDGTFEEIAAECGLDDPFENARGVTALDANNDGLFDLVCGNWEGLHRLFLQSHDGRFDNAATPEMAYPSRVRTVIAADFDNDGYEEIFFNNIGEHNRLFGLRNNQWTMLPIGDALEPSGLGTGAAVGDFDDDGRLELLVSHGEAGIQPLTLYHTPVNGNRWLRVLPLTRQGAPARGALVTLVMSIPGQPGVRRQRRVIDAGSGYLCQMEPVAHFGLGAEGIVQKVEVRWLDGTQYTVDAPEAGQLLRVPHPGDNFDF